MLHFVLHKGPTPKTNNVLKYNKLQRFRTTSKIYISFYRPYDPRTEAAWEELKEKMRRKREEQDTTEG